MTLHLIKLSVGPDTLSDLIDWQTQRLKDMARKCQKLELMHITRHMPRRGEELLSGGSIYWVIKGFICARQKLLELRSVVRDGIPHCGLVYDHEMVRVKMRPQRAFQGWRYLKDAPPDLSKGAVEEEMPEKMRRELAELGLL